MNEFTRRDFIKLSASTIGALTLSTTKFGQVKAPGAPTFWWQGETQTKYSYCDMCYWHCGIKVKVAKWRAVKIYGDENDPLSEGKLCPRGQAGIKQLYNPVRLKKPLISVGKRGEGKYRQASWEEALDYSAEKLSAISEKWDGPEAIAWLTHCASGKWFGHLAAA